MTNIHFASSTTHAKCKGQIPLRYPGRRQVRGWSETCSELEFGLSSSELAAS